MPDLLRERLQATLGAAYTLEQELGGGGMSRVFVAQELALGRRIVVKVLAPELAEGISAERFAREVRLAARLQHPNIVPVLAAGTGPEGLPYYTMPFIAGASLRDRLAAGPLSLPEAVTVLRDVARALACAHGEGVVHRDVKPENVLLSGGAAVVTDFGIAKALSAAGSPATVTQAGMAVGTPAYMAPEQAAGQGDVDHRADLYAWGLLAWEALAGTHPFADRTSALALIGAQLTVTPTPIAERRAEVPTALSTLVAACLAKEPAARPDDARAILQALDAVVFAAPVAGAGVATPRNGLRSLAVLPFANLSSDPENEYLSDGLTDEIIGTLGRTPALRIAGRASSFALKGQALDARTIGDRLNVTAVVEGSVRRVGSRIRVQAELVNAADGFQLWSERYDRELTDIFAVQEEIAGAIAAALATRLGEAPDVVSPAVVTPAVATPNVATPNVGTPRATVPVHPEAYRLYLQAVHALRTQSSPASYARVLALLERARELDPSLARTHLATAVAYSNLAVFSHRPAHEVMPRAREAARAAVALDPTLAEAHAMLAQVTYVYDWQWAEAEAGFARAVALGADDVGTLTRAALFHAAASRGGAHHADEAARLVAHACAIDPLSAWVRFVGGLVLVLLRRYDDALDVLREAVELDPHHGLATMVLAGALRDTGDLDAALPVMERALELTGRNPINLVSALVLHVTRGDRVRATAAVDELLARAAGGHVMSLHVALAHAWTGRADDAFAWLERAVDAHDFWLVTLAVDPVLEPLRDDARLMPLLRRVGMPGV